MVRIEIFDRDSLNLLQTVFDGALKELPALSGRARSLAIVQINRNILDALNGGERDREKLKDLALKGMRSKK
ncbi:hypothetical protein SAMN05519104_5188 [Rhizobiales bacterium GAS188]|nr:hypothetical protein SAMN05519104_5188 [Rhizobiales bacterium GAS188]